MRLYFADTWYFVALLSRRDRSHGAAVALEYALAESHLVTHDGVLGELLTFFSGSGAAKRTQAAAYVRELFDDPGLTILESDRKLVLAGLSLYERRRDKQYSLVDCMSMHVMQTHGITHALTNDHHFSQEGFTVLSDAP